MRQNDPKDRKVKMVPVEEIWTKEFSEKVLREIKPEKGDREFFKFRREAMAQRTAENASAEKAATGKC